MLGATAPPMTFGRSVPLTWDPGLEILPAISPDGRAVAYAAGNTARVHIYVRQTAGGRPIRVADDSAIVEQAPSWSPDGSRVLYLARGAVFSAPAAGGAPRQEVPGFGQDRITAAAWAPDGRTILFAAGDSLHLRNPDGSTRMLARVAEPTMCAWSPSAELVACSSGNARYVTFGVQFGNLSPNRIVVVRVRDGATTTITDSTSNNVSPAWSRDGRQIYYVSNRQGRGDIYAQEIDRAGRATAPAMRLTTGLGAHTASLSSDGTRLAYAIFTPSANLWSVPIPSGGPITATGATPVTFGANLVENSNVSRDGRWLVYDTNIGGTSDIYRISLSAPNAEPERLTNDPADDFSAESSPDGSEIVFHSWRTGSRDVFVQPLDGRPLQRVTSSPAQEWVARWSPDGRALVFSYGVESQSVWIVRRGADGKWGAPVQRVAAGLWPAWSPDGRWIAYCAARGGSLLVTPVDSGPARVVLDVTRPGMPQVEQPLWGPDGRTIYFKSHDADGLASFWSVPMTGGTPRLLVRLDDPERQSYRAGWSLGRDRIYFPIEDRQSDVWVMDVTPRDR